MKRVVVFDMDDTLFPEWQYVLSGFRAVDGWLERNRGVIGFFPRAKALFEAGSRGDIFDLALPGTEKSLIDQLVNVYREHAPTLELFEDARWALEYFHARGPLGLISDGYLIPQQLKFEALKIAPYFQAVVMSDALGRDSWKPSPAPYLRIMELIPGAPGDYVYIADNPKKDFVTARKLGWGTVQIARPEGIYHNVEVPGDHRADCVIQSLFELEKL